ncbi:MAG: PorV/PorQ family protein [Bacteroidota bacterium]|nr:PorV/PorQ family protein [Bacteroidota bacterium]MDP4234436.1 PorV/PorQ family protein [Bacteroidota bacterium]MDP4244002.1 PorV/PorQ family protein [Bacteroidota bacterium]MDP4288168.1 PorV/PorQ family protein [Bacteroidota bacterium]
MRRITPILLVLLVFGTTIRAQEVDLSGRTRLSDLLNKPLSPRAAAMGNSFVAMKDDPNTIFSNPAALSSLTIKDSTQLNEFSLSYSHYILDINEGALVYDHPVPEGMLFSGTFAAGVQYFSGGTSTEATNTGQTIGTFSTGDVALLLAYSSTGSNGLHYGAGLKFVSSSLVSGSSIQNYSASWLAADLGLYYEWVKQQMTFGFSVLNIGTEVSTYAGVQEPVGTNVQFGVSKRLERLPLTVHLNFHNLTRDREGRNLLYALNDFSVGGEFILGKVVRLRFGYENEVRHQLAVPAGTGLAGFSTGLGFHLKKYDIDFGLNDNGPDFGPFLRFGLRTAF